MRKNIIYLLLSAVVFCSCTKEKPVIIPKLEITGIADSAIVAVNSISQYIASPAAKWSLLNTKAGTIDSTGKFTAGTNEGVFTLIAINSKDKLDTLKRRLIVLKQADLINEIKKGGYIFSFRHASASYGSDNTGSKIANWWKSCDYNLARQITLPIGKNQSDSTGKVMKFLKIPMDSTLTSEFCRCKQTAEYFNLGVPNKEMKELTFSVYDETNRYDNTMKLFASRPITKKNIVAVGHAGFGKTPNPAPLATLQWGDCAVFKQMPGGLEPTFVKTITVIDWVNMAKVLR
jgi:phosphohistidine phosphatase SixA